MIIFYQILALTLTMLLMFFLIRSVIRMKIEDTLSKRKRKKLARSQTFYEWFFYKRYDGVLPKFNLVCYYANMIAYVVLIFVVLSLHFINLGDFGNTIVSAYFVTSAMLLLTMKIFS